MKVKCEKSILSFKFIMKLNGEKKKLLKMQLNRFEFVLLKNLHLIFFKNDLISMK